MASKKVKVQIKFSTLHVATSHFYHDSYYPGFRSIYKLRLLLVTFCLWFVVVEVAMLAKQNGGQPRKACDQSKPF